MLTKRISIRPTSTTRKRLASDADISDETIQKCITFLSNRLSPEDVERFKKHVTSDKPDSEDYDDPPTPYVGPDDLKGKEKSSSSMAADSRGNSWADPLAGPCAVANAKTSDTAAAPWWPLRFLQNSSR
jgi:hypothetical protein